MDDQGEHADARGGHTDIVVLGGDLTAGILASVLARHGARVLMLDPGTSPKPGRGVVTLPFTAFFCELIAARYDVPEIAQLARSKLVRSEISPLSGVQRTIGFSPHTAENGYDPGLSTQFNLPSEHGESNLYRPDVEEWIRAVATRHGAEVRTGARPHKVVSHRDSVEVLVGTDERVFAGCLVDTYGNDAVSNALSITRQCPGDQPSPWVFTTRLRGLPGFEEAAAPLPDSPRWSAGILHHVLAGAWLGITPFDNGEGPGATGLADVTLGTVDPLDGDPWSALLRQVHDAPSVRWQMGRAHPLEMGPAEESCWVASSRTTDRIVLLDQAALSGDPVFARDMCTSVELAHTAAGDLLAAFRDGDFRTERFGYLDRLQLGMARTQHRMARACAAASTNPALWSMLSRVWLLGTMFSALTVKRALKAHATPAVENALGMLRSAPEHGTCCPTMPEYRDLWEMTLTECELYGSATITGRQAVSRIISKLRASTIVPPIFGFDDLSEQVYVLRRRDRLRTLLWARNKAAEGARRLVLSYGLQGEGRAA